MKLLRAVAVVVVLLVAALEALRLVPLQMLRDPIDRAITAATGRPVRISGAIRFELDLDPHIEVEDVRIGELPGEAGFQHLELEFRLRPIFRGVLDVSKVVLVGGRIELDGTAAPEAGDVRPPAASGGTGAVQLSHLDLVGEDLDVVHRSRAGLTTRIRFDRLEVRARHGDRPIRVDAAGAFDGLAFDLTAESGTPSQLASGGPLPLRVSGGVAGLTLRAEGRVGRPRDLADYEVATSLDAPHLAALGALRGRSLPEIGPVHAQATLRDVDGRAGLEGIAVRIGDRQDAVEMTFEGELDDLAELDEISFSLSLRARDLQVVGRLAGVELPPVQGVTLTGRFRGSDELLASEAFSLGLGATRIEGALSGTFVPGRRPTLKARLESPVVHLDDLGLGDSVHDPAPDRGRDGGTFYERRLPFDALPRLDAEVAIRAHEVVGEADLMIDELSFDLVSSERRLAIEGLQVDFAGGAVSGEAVVNPAASPPTLALELDGTGVHIHRLLAQLEESPSVSGLADAYLHVAGAGWSVRDWIASADGAVTLLLRDGRVRTRYANALQTDLLQAAFRGRGPREFSRIRCMLADTQLSRGVAEIETLWFETDDTTIRATGRIDLGRQRYDVEVRPTPKKPGLIGYAAAVSVTGPFADPIVRPITGSVATSAIKGLLSSLKRTADPLLSPVTDPILAKFWKQRGGERGPCAGFAAKRP